MSSTTLQVPDGCGSARVLYLASGGLHEPLIQSQVVRYLRWIARHVQTCHLITLERDAFDLEQKTKETNELSAAGIEWHPITARSGNRLLNMPLEIRRGAKLGAQLCQEHGLNLVHARSFLPGNIGLRLKKKLGVRFLYDMRGFWATEKFAKGTIKSGWLKKIASSIENRLFTQADHLISLTQAGLEFLREHDVKPPATVIPCCADVDLFEWDERPRSQFKKFVSIGSLGPGYLAAELFGLFRQIQRVNPDAELQILSRTDPGLLKGLAEKAGCNLESVRIGQAKPTEIPGYLREADVGLCFVQPSQAKLASSPTKVAEYLACGLPFIANCKSIGDMSQLVHEHRVGSEVVSFDDAGYQGAIDALQNLLQEPQLSQRCRKVAEEHFSLRVGVERYLESYARILDQ